MTAGRPRLAAVANAIGLGTLPGTVAHGVAAIFVMPVLNDMAVGTPLHDVTWYGIGAAWALVALDVPACAFRRGNLAIHAGGRTIKADGRPRRAPPPPPPRPETREPPRLPPPDDEGARARALLGVGPDAGPEEVKAAWRAAAKAHHPDHNAPGDARARERFIAAQRAYRTLSGRP